MPVPYANLNNPQTLNRYAYVLNDPLTKRDPDGHYECLGSVCDQLSKTLNLLSELAASKNLNTAERDMLTAAVGLYGKKGEKNGVVVVSGSKDNSEMKDGVITIQLNLSGKDKSISAATGKELTPQEAAVEKAATVAHEGDHGVRDLVHGRMPANKTEEFSSEREAYKVQGMVNKAAGVDSAIGVWTSEGDITRDISTKVHVYQLKSLTSREKTPNENPARGGLSAIFRDNNHLSAVRRLKPFLRQICEAIAGARDGSNRR